MSKTPDMSRRDWFRLRIPSEQRWLGDENSRPDESNVLKSIDQPPNHDGMNLDDLPPLREAILPAENVAALLNDIEKCATDIRLMQRRGTAESQDTSGAASMLRTVGEMFLNGRVNRLQIRYRWQGSLWIDTLATQGNETRLVRIAHRESNFA